MVVRRKRRTQTRPDPKDLCRVGVAKAKTTFRANGNFSGRNQTPIHQLTAIDPIGEDASKASKNKAYRQSGCEQSRRRSGREAATA